MLAPVSRMASKDLVIGFPNKAITCLSCIHLKDGGERGPEGGPCRWSEAMNTELTGKHRQPWKKVGVESALAAALCFLENISIEWSTFSCSEICVHHLGWYRISLLSTTANAYFSRCVTSTGMLSVSVKGFLFCFYLKCFCVWLFFFGMKNNLLTLYLPQYIPQYIDCTFLHLQHLLRF